MSWLSRNVLRRPLANPNSEVCSSPCATHFSAPEPPLTLVCMPGLFQVRILYSLQISGFARLPWSLHLLIIHHTTEDTTQLWDVDDSSSSPSIGVAPSSLLLLLLELKGLVVKKGGIRGGPKVNWPVSSRSDSSRFTCLWKTPFSHWKTPGLQSGCHPNSHPPEGSASSCLPYRVDSRGVRFSAVSASH